MASLSTFLFLQYFYTCLFRMSGSIRLGRPYFAIKLFFKFNHDCFFYSNLYEVGWDVKACGWGDKSMAVKIVNTAWKNIDASLSKAYDINFKFSRPTFILNISIYAPALTNSFLILRNFLICVWLNEMILKVFLEGVEGGRFNISESSSPSRFFTHLINGSKLNGYAYAFIEWEVSI